MSIALTVWAGAAGCSLNGDIGCDEGAGNCGNTVGAMPTSGGNIGGLPTAGAPTQAGGDTATVTGGTTSTPLAGAGGSSGGDSSNPAAGSPAAPPLDCSKTSVGVTPLRRLNREQYSHAVRDVLGLTTATVVDLPADEKVGVFFNNAATPVDRLVVEQYLDSAEAFATAAVANLSTVTTCDRATLGDAACALELIQRIGARAYRRPLTAAETERYTTLFATYAADFSLGLRQVLTAMLQSPYFLYQLELSPTADVLATPRLLDGFELATRLSMTLWGSIPDDQLLGEAANGALATTEAVRTAAMRMLDDPRAAEALQSFSLQWLGLDSLAGLAKDPATFPDFNSELSAAMRKETTHFVDYVVRETNGSLGTLLTSPLSFPEGPLAALYGVLPSVDPNLPVALDPTQRAGLLTQASFLATQAHPNQTSPVRRGVAIRRNLMCATLPDPPPTVNAAAPAIDASATTRQRFAAHSESPSCVGCHALIDPIGFGFENYDALGRFRTVENGVTIDATGSILAGDGSSRSFNGAVELAQELADSPEVQRCFSRQWFRFALGRFEATADQCSLAKIDESFASSGFNIRELLLALVTSDAFRHAQPAAQ